MSFERLNGHSFGDVQARVARNYGGAFSELRAFFATIKFCLGFDQAKVQQALENLARPVVPQTPLRDTAITFSAKASGIAGTNPPEVQTKLTALKSELRREILHFRLKANVTRGVFQELSGKLDNMLAAFYDPALRHSSNADAVHNALYALKEKIDNFLKPHAEIAYDRGIDGAEAFKQEILKEAVSIEGASEWGS
ncbi:MAG: hypothetical protein LBT57_00675 [Puniceicoccales bacterium]|jgi:hypothetical protein|nr:hypothetical protein [Puniceicoccales bacterium]